MDLDSPLHPLHFLALRQSAPFDVAGTFAMSYALTTSFKAL